MELLSLEHLSAAGVAAHLPIAQGPVVDPAVVTLVHERSGGNPLFVRALARLLGPDLGGPAPAPAALSRRLAGCSEVRLLVASVLRSLDAGVQALLRLASVLGEEIEPALLADVAGQPREDVDEALETAGRGSLTW